MSEILDELAESYCFDNRFNELDWDMVVNAYKTGYTDTFGKIQSLEEENKKLRECVERFADLDACGEYGFGRATKCLKELEDNNGV